MAKATEHGRIIAAAAKAALVPLGLTRKGRSRIWIDDHGYWIGAVEFQPSGWAKGSYLNIFAAWLWRKSIGYSYYYRPVFFVKFETHDQFSAAMKDMASTAAIEIKVTREKFRSFSRILSHIDSLPVRDGSRVYDAAVAHALAGNIEKSRQFFDRMAAWQTNGYDWEERLKAESKLLADLIDDPRRFRAAISSIIDEQRTIRRLPAPWTAARSDADAGMVMLNPPARQRRSR